MTTDHIGKIEFRDLPDGILDKKKKTPYGRYMLNIKDIHKVREIDIKEGDIINLAGIGKFRVDLYIAGTYNTWIDVSTISLEK